MSEPDGLLNFDTSDWVNLAESYCHQAIHRWDNQENSIRALFEDYCEQAGYTIMR